MRRYINLCLLLLTTLFSCQGPARKATYLCRDDVTVGKMINTIKLPYNHDSEHQVALTGRYFNALKPQFSINEEVTSYKLPPGSFRRVKKLVW